MTALTFERAGILPVTLNVAKQSKTNWRAANELRNWRKWGREVGAGQQMPPGPVAVTIEHLRRDRSAMPDTGAPILAAKAAIDGLVDAGVIPADTPDVVHRLTFEAPRIVGYHGLRITLTPFSETPFQPALEGIQTK